MPQKILRKYGIETTVNFTLFDTDGVDFKVDAVHASGDTKISKNEGAEANTTYGFTDEGTGYSLVLTATEMEAARIVVYIVDQGTKQWLDEYLVIESYGSAFAQHEFDLDNAISAYGGIVESNLKQIDDNSVNGNLATLTLKSLSVISDVGSAAVFQSTYSGGSGIYVHGSNGGSGMRISSYNRSALKIVGPASGDYAALECVGGDNTTGVIIRGGYISGKGMHIMSQANNDNALELSAHGTGKDIDAKEIDQIIVDVEGTIDANIISIDGDLTSGYNATLYLKQLDIQNSSGVGLSISGSDDGVQISGGGDGVTIAATNGHGLYTRGGGAGAGLYAESGTTSGATGIRATSNASAVGYGFICNGVGAGKDISADEIDNIQTDVTAIKANTDNLPDGIKKNTNLDNFEFLMVDSANHITPATSLTITATRSIDGGSFAACANSVTELSDGIYVIDLDATDLNGDVITFKFVASGADTRYITIKTDE